MKLIAKQELKKRACRAIDEHRDRIIAIGQQVLLHPEFGYKEFKTAAIVRKTLDNLAIPYQAELAITGVKGALAGRAPGPTLALLGELDAIPLPGHPTADPATGAAHACGHNAQIAGLLGAAIAIQETEAMRSLAGRLVLFAVPAEEYVDFEYRTQLIREGKIEFVGGKPESIRLGHFDEIDLSMMMHMISQSEGCSAGIADSGNGCVAKRIEFLGKAAHAGCAPHEGINALNAAMLAISAIHAQRETFQESHAVRVHPIITRGGDTVNVVPSRVSMETYVRGKTLEVIEDATRKLERALKAGAMAVGAKVEIRTVPGYMPVCNDKRMGDVFMKNAGALFGEENVRRLEHRLESTDMGDVSLIIPSIHPYISGAEGVLHGIDWNIVDPDKAYLGMAKLLATTAIDLLYDDAQEARDILKTTGPKMTKEQYLQYQRATNRVEVYGA